MENILRTIKSEVIELNKKVGEEIEEYKKQIEDEPDEVIKIVLRNMMRCQQMFYIFQLGVINEIKDIVFFRNALQNLKTCEIEFSELVYQHTNEYNIEEHCYLDLCNLFFNKSKSLETFLVRLEDANLHPEKYNY